MQMIRKQKIFYNEKNYLMLWHKKNECLYFANIFQLCDLTDYVSITR